MRSVQRLIVPWRDGRRFRKVLISLGYYSIADSCRLPVGKFPRSSGEFGSRTRIASEVRRYDLARPIAARPAVVLGVAVLGRSNSLENREHLICTVLSLVYLVNALSLSFL